MRYSEIVCPVCQNMFNDGDDIVVCPVCGTPHHRECWLKENKCVNEALHETGFEWEFPKGKDPVEKINKESEDKKQRSANPDFSFKNGEGVKICPRCGSMNYEHDAFCMRCRAPLGEENNRSDIQEQSSPENEENLFNEEELQYRGRVRQRPLTSNERMMVAENQRLYGGLEPNTPVFGIPAAELSAYIGGRNPGKTIRRYALNERYGSKFSLNFAALFFGPLYFLYRKMYKIGALLTAAVLAVFLSSILLIASTPVYQDYCKASMDIMMEMIEGKITREEASAKSAEAEEVLQSTVPPDKDRYKLFFAELLRYISFFIYAACGILFNTHYLKKIKADIETARRENDNMESYIGSLISKGGTSLIAPVISLVITLICFTVFSVIISNTFLM